MRAILLLGLASVVGCGASQAAPVATATTKVAEAAPEVPQFSIVSDTAGTVLVSNAALSAIPAGPNGWQIEFVSVRGHLSQLQGQTFNLPANGSSGGSWYINQGPALFANIHMTSDSEVTRLSILRFGSPCGVKTSFGHGNNLLVPRIGVGLQSATNGVGMVQDGAVVNLIPY